MFRTQKRYVCVNNRSADSANTNTKEHDQKQRAVNSMPAVGIKSSEQDAAQACEDPSNKGNPGKYMLLASGLQPVCMPPGEVCHEDCADLCDSGDNAPNHEERFQAMGTDVGYEAVGRSTLSPAGFRLGLEQKASPPRGTYATYGLV